MISDTEFFKNPPKLHVHPGLNEPVFWGFDETCIRYLGSLVPAGGRTMETGAGMSSVYFAMLGFEHTAIAPDAALMERIRSYCVENGIDTSKLHLIDACSEDYLSRTDLPDLDLFLVDGRHAFPTPILDYYYGAKALKVGGHMVIDDTQIITGKLLADFLGDDHHWDLDRVVATTSIFRKLDSDVHSDGWGAQAFCTNGRTITEPQAIDGDLPLAQRISSAWKSCQAGDFKDALAKTKVVGKGESVADQYECLVVRAHALRHLERFPDAHDALAKATRLVPTGPSALIERAWLELQTSEPAKAVATAEGLLTHELPQAQMAGALHVLGVAQASNNDTDSAYATLTKAVEAAPNNMWVRLHRGGCAAVMGRADEARADLGFVLERDPKNAEALGHLQRLSGD